ncbi:MAG TPA: hypothetical protein VHE36_01265 [Sphingomicrobium sp.]|nr:hypothetical protein [Sphingomicrobium sp.]
MTTGRMIELAAAAILLAAAVVLYRRRDPASEGYGNQGAVILLVISVIMAIHALGALDYHPSKAEAEYFKEQSH